MKTYVSLNLKFAKNYPNDVRIININGEDVVYNSICFAEDEQEAKSNFLKSGESLPIGGFFHLNNVGGSRSLTKEEIAILLK